MNNEERAFYMREYRATHPDYCNSLKEIIRRWKLKHGSKDREHHHRWQKENPSKVLAHHIVNNSIRSGLLIKINICSCCGVSGVKTEGHHFDYNKPLEVTWLCHKCHRELHLGEK
jgi:hypothetical protein